MQTRTEIERDRTQKAHENSKKETHAQRDCGQTTAFQANVK